MVNLQIGIFCAFLLSSLALQFKQARIVGGKKAEVGQFPHQISLQRYGQHICSGSIIADKWVVTAAHCVVETTVSQYTVLAGTNSLRRGGTTVKVKRTIVHENYGNFQNDIALLELSNPLNFDKTINSIIITRKEVPTGGNIIISGWGDLYTDGRTPDYLQYNTFIKKLAPNICRNIYSDVYYNGLICLESDSGNGICDGDSGGPALYDDELVGVTSFGATECGTSQPDAFTKISFFRDWINKNTLLNL